MGPGVRLLLLADKPPLSSIYSTFPGVSGRRTNRVTSAALRQIGCQCYVRKQSRCGRAGRPDAPLAPDVRAPNVPFFLGKTCRRHRRGDFVGKNRGSVDCARQRRAKEDVDRIIRGAF
jgi:hypothetical protein